MKGGKTMYFLVGNFTRDEDGYVYVTKKEKLYKKDFENAHKIKTFQIFRIDGYLVEQYIPKEDNWEKI